MDTERLENVRYVVDSSGSVVQSYLYSPFGQIHTESGSLNQPYQYVGGEGYYTEQDINLQLLGQRWYNAEVGKFISRDPIFSSNFYFYGKNNPLTFIDPLGLKEDVFKKFPFPDISKFNVPNPPDGYVWAWVELWDSCKNIHPQSCTEWVCWNPYKKPLGGWLWPYLTCMRRCYECDENNYKIRGCTQIYMLIFTDKLVESFI